MTYELYAGLAVRNQVRRYLLRRGTDFKEDKGWIDSRFYIKCSSDEIQEIYKDIARAYPPTP